MPLSHLGIRAQQFSILTFYFIIPFHIFLWTDNYGIQFSFWPSNSSWCNRRTWTCDSQVELSSLGIAMWYDHRFSNSSGITLSCGISASSGNSGRYYWHLILALLSLVPCIVVWCDLRFSMIRLIMKLAGWYAETFLVVSRHWRWKVKQLQMLCIFNLYMSLISHWPTEKWKRATAQI